MKKIQKWGKVEKLILGKWWNGAGIGGWGMKMVGESGKFLN